MRSLGFLGWASSSPDTWTAVAERLLELSAQKDNAVVSAAGEALCLTFSGMLDRADSQKTIHSCHVIGQLRAGSDLGLSVEDVLVTDWTGLSAWEEAHQGHARVALAQMAVDSADQDRSAVQSKILEAILDKYLGSTRKEQRAAGTIWLVCLLQFVGTKSATLTTKLTACQEALIPVWVWNRVSIRRRLL